MAVGDCGVISVLSCVSSVPININYCCNYKSAIGRHKCTISSSGQWKRNPCCWYCLVGGDKKKGKKKFNNISLWKNNTGRTTKRNINLCGITSTASFLSDYVSIVFTCPQPQQHGFVVLLVFVIWRIFIHFRSGLARPEFFFFFFVRSSQSNDWQWQLSVGTHIPATPPLPLPASWSVAYLWLRGSIWLLRRYARRNVPGAYR